MLKILWIDDNHEKADRFVMSAKKLGLELEGGKSPESVQRLKKNPWKYSAVLLDVNILETEDSKESPSHLHGNKAIKEINDIRVKKFPIVIYSGVDKTLDGEDGFRLYNEEYEVFDKKNIYHSQKCLETLKELAQNQPEYQIKKENQKFFNISKSLLPQQCFKQILTILLDKNPNYRGYFTQLRTIIEKGVFESLKKHGLIPNLHGVSKPSRFMSGEVVDNFELMETPPEKIKHLLFFLIKKFENPGSHSFTYAEENENLVKGLCYLTMDVCIWLEVFVANAKKNNWKTYSDHGIITKKLEDYAFLKSDDFPEGIIFYKNENKDSWERLGAGDSVSFSVLKTTTKKTEKYIKYKALIRDKMNESNS